MLYDLVSCPHRVTMDLFNDPEERDPPNPFVQLLWEKGSLFEKKVVEGLEVPFTDLSMYADHEKERLTLQAMRRGETLIYCARIQHAGLFGDPDLLRRDGDGYVAGDIKSGSAEEGPQDNSKPKKNYAVQLGLYTDILERMGLSAGRRAFVWDVDGVEAIYDFDRLQGKRNPRTLWQDYQDCLSEAQAIVERSANTLPSYSSVCKLCHWYTVCTSRLVDTNDLTLIPQLGRANRQTLMRRIATIRALAESDPTEFLDGKKTIFPGIAPASLEKFHARAKLLSAGERGKPYLREPIALPRAELELYFDIEVDPMRNICYLHGFVERPHYNNEMETFVAFFADAPTEQAERRAFEEAWAYLQDRQPYVMYYYSKYERTIYRKLREKYPDVCTEHELEVT